MLLALDVGNTNIVLAVFEGDRLVADWRVRTEKERTADEHGILVTDLLRLKGIEPKQITGIAISNVVPTMRRTLLELSKRYFLTDPFMVGPDTDFGIGIHYDPPSDVGADRLMNTIAAFAKYGGPAVVVDFGTGTTFDAVGANGDYLGGAIAAGIGISTDALFQRAARLYRVELKAPSRAVGTDTVMALQSGIMFGFAGQVDAIVHRFKQEIGAHARVIATGGLAEVIQAESETIEIIDQMLTLDGLRMLWERNCG
jgi:type III pantothenate kinase